MLPSKMFKITDSKLNLGIKSKSTHSEYVVLCKYFNVTVGLNSTFLEFDANDAS